MGDVDDPGTEGGQAGGGEPVAASVQGEQTWLVQRTEVIEPFDPADKSRVVWTDVGSVVVAPRTRRRTIVEKALEEFPDAVPPKGQEGVLFRVLDSDSAAEIPVRWEVPPAPEPELKIG